MLVPIVFIVAFLLALTGAVLENALHQVRVLRSEAVSRYSEVAIADGVADLTGALAR